MNVDESGDDVPAVEFDHAVGRGAGQIPDPDDAPVANPHVGAEPRIPRAVQDASATQQDIESRLLSGHGPDEQEPDGGGKKERAKVTPVHDRFPCERYEVVGRKLRQVVHWFQPGGLAPGVRRGNIGGP